MLLIRMIAEIFYPIFTLSIIILVFYTKKKKLFRGSHPRLHQGITLDLMVEGLTAPPRTAVPIVFGFSKNPCTHIFSVLSPEIMY